MAGRALVLGGGGITGAAWELGLLMGFEEAGVDLTTADAVIGTSAGANIGAQILSGRRLQQLYERQLADPEGEIPVHIGFGGLARLASLILMPGDERTMLARVGRAALRAHTMTEDTRRNIIANRLPVHEWPERDLRITTVDAETGEFIVLTKAKGVDLVDAVAASSAAPLVYPPTTIAGRRYIDGGTRSAANADLAAGFDPVVVIAPFSLGIRRSQKLESQVAKLGASVKAIVVKPDEAARKAMGRQALDPAFRAPSARAGRTQGASVAKEVAGVWALAKN